MTQSTNTSIPVFNHPEFGDLEIIFIDDKPYFPATACARTLGYKNPQDAIRTHCKGVREMLTPSAGGQQAANFIPEGDLYRLIIRSKLPAAEKFELWVFDDLLPTLRRTGSYSMNQQPQLDAPSTKEDREPLTNIVNTLVSVAPVSHRDVWHMVKAELKTSKAASEFTVSEVHRAIDFVQSRVEFYTTRVLPRENDVHAGIITDMAMQGVSRFDLVISIGENVTQNDKLIMRQFKAEIRINEETPIRPYGATFSIQKR